MIVSYIKLATPLRVLLSVVVVFLFFYAWSWWNWNRRWVLTSFQHPVHFTAGDIVSKTTSENLIGKGGSGNVYRVRLSHLEGTYAYDWVPRFHWPRLPPLPLDFGRSGSRRARLISDFIGRRGAASDATGGHRTVAVKELKKAKKQEDKNLDKQFDAEVKALGSIRLRNIIALLCCITGISTSLLVYEDMQNGSLDQWLHKPRGGLDWPSRVAIAVDALKGLCYMHDQAIIHRDVKSSNILLDRDFGAKIGDFGLARVLAKPGESEPASAVCGTPGHIAPEYFRNAEVSETVDVYSFGVVLLELITGKKPHNAATEPGIGLARWASEQSRRNKVLWEHIIDKDIQNPAYEEDMKAVFKLGLRCTREDPFERPAMNEVLQEVSRYDRSRVKRRGKKRTTESFVAKVYSNIRAKIFRRG